jgi:hypothetical protein
MERRDLESRSGSTSILEISAPVLFVFFEVLILRECFGMMHSISVFMEFHIPIFSQFGDYCAMFCTL